jgi:hypothetical protein
VSRKLTEELPEAVSLRVLSLPWDPSAPAQLTPELYILTNFGGNHSESPNPPAGP